MTQARRRQQATAASEPLVLGDREFRLSPLTDRDLAELDGWVQSRCVQIARASLPPESTQDERDETIRLAMETSLSLTWMSGAGSKIMATVDGMTRLLWQMCRREHPDLTPDQLRGHLLDPANLAQVRHKFTTLNKVPKSKNPQAPAEETTPTGAT